MTMTDAPLIFPPPVSNRRPNPRALFGSMGKMTRGLKSREAIEQRLFELSYTADQIARFLSRTTPAARN